MINSDDPLTLIEIPGKLLEAIVKTLAAVGIELPLVGLQVFLLVLTLVTAVLIGRQLRREKNKPLLWLGLTGLVLISFSLFFIWIDEIINPYPNEINGTVEILGRPEVVRYNQIIITLHDFRQRQLAVNYVTIDSETGEFCLYYKGEFGERPRYLNATAPGCQSEKVHINVSKWRKGQQFHLKIRYVEP